MNVYFVNTLNKSWMGGGGGGRGGLSPELVKDDLTEEERRDFKEMSA